MSRIKPILCAAAIILMIAAATMTAAEQPGCDPLGFYDVVLPMAVGEADQRGSDEVVLIRYIPGDTSHDREYQIAIVVSVAGKITARRLDPAGSSFREQLRQLESQRPSDRCDLLLKDLKSELRRFDRQPPLQRVMRDFSRLRVPARLPASIYLDAPRYEVVCWTKMNQASFVIYSGLDTAKNPLIAWVKEVNAALPASR